MVGQTRHILEQYEANGGSFEEVVIAETGHSPYIEKPDGYVPYNKSFEIIFMVSVGNGENSFHFPPFLQE